MARRRGAVPDALETTEAGTLSPVAPRETRRRAVRRRLVRRKVARRR